jgi:hypothetical protein
MNNQIEKEKFVFCDAYPKHVIIIRWIILIAAFALGIYILSGIKDLFGVVYVIYSLIALTLILPLSRCVSCFYHGKLCNTGWGKVAAYLFPKGMNHVVDTKGMNHMIHAKVDESKYVEHYNYAILLHLLWLIPLLGSFFQLLRKRGMIVLILFIAYLFILLLEKIVLKKLACKRCHQREFCPALPFRKER